jgi:predicted nuclease of predicted toxin-antitoxin system
MNPLALPLIADENIHPGVIDFLRQSGFDVVSVREVGLGGKSDAAIIQFAFAHGRIILTHDSDFGRLVFMRQTNLTGIIYLRPGHIRPEFTIATIQYLESRSFDIQLPFIIVAERSGESIRVRVRQL